MKRKKASSVKVPPRLLPYIAPEELEMARECEAMDRMEAEKKKQTHCSPNFDRRVAVEAYLSADDPIRGASLIALVAASVPTEQPLDVASALMKGLKPRNTLEVLLLSQMAGTHFVGMNELQKAANSKDHQATDYHTGRAVRLLRTFCLQVEALESLRSRGSKKQKIVVQHQHVNVAAGQAVVGVRQGV